MKFNWNLFITDLILISFAYAAGFMSSAIAKENYLLYFLGAYVIGIFLGYLRRKSKAVVYYPEEIDT